jgi:negative regulator of sigma-B (phosphoserine phosphatase)
MGGLKHGLVHNAIQGEKLCGDQFGIFEQGEFAIVAVVDGLGHGPGAHAAAVKAIELVETRLHKPVQELLEDCHKGLSSTRGAVMGIARIDRLTQTLTYAGLGNIEARLVGAERVRRPVSVNGIVGYKANRFRCETFPFEYGDLLMMHSDGVSDRFDLTPASRHGDLQMLAFQLVNAHGRVNDDQLMLIVKDEP